jgi:hypothetical protein
MEFPHVEMPEHIKSHHNLRSNCFPRHLEESCREFVRSWRLIWWHGVDHDEDFFLNEMR